MGFTLIVDSIVIKLNTTVVECRVTAIEHGFAGQPLKILWPQGDVLPVVGSEFHFTFDERSLVR